MLLKTRISVLFAITFLLIAAALVVQSQLARDEIKRAVVTELSLGQSVIWDKILRSTYDSMSFMPMIRSLARRRYGRCGGRAVPSRR
jgi:hypothetical protein